MTCYNKLVIKLSGNVETSLLFLIFEGYTVPKPEGLCPVVFNSGPGA